jgi:uncharacterized tellurite resistance protein B-like protein
MLLVILLITSSKTIFMFNKKILELFESRKKKKKLSHIKHLFALAVSDGEFSSSEKKLIIRIGLLIGLSIAEIQRVVERPDSIKLRVPERKEEKLELLYDMILVMLIDGNLDESELTLCKAAAHGMGISEVVVPVLMNQIVESIDDSLPFEEAITKLMVTAKM